MTSNLRHSWPPSRETLRDLIRDHSQKKLGEMYGVAPQTVSKLAAALGIDWPRRTRIKRSKAQQEQTKTVLRANSALFRKRTPYTGEREEVAEFLARGGTITKIPPAYAAPVISGSPFYGNSRRPG